MRLRLFVVALLLVITGCRVPGTIPQDSHLPSEPAAARPTPYPRAQLPQDEAPHENLTEWWYYTGHLDPADGGPAEYGFQLVVFQILRGRIPPIYVAQFAISDISAGTFHYGERTTTQQYIMTSSAPGFALTVDGWSMRGLNGNDQLHAAMPGYAIDLQLAATKPAALHDNTGLIFYKELGYSYYYSRTNMNISGTLTVDGRPLPVTGEAWFDHQWGDFIGLLGGGWDWFSVQLEDRTEYMLWEIRDQQTGALFMRGGSRIEPDGTVVSLPPGSFLIDVTTRWISPHTGGDYPAGWVVRLPEENTTLTITPQLADQELNLTQTTGVAYWEGAVAISGSKAGTPVAGRGYVELTGYAPAAK